MYIFRTQLLIRGRRVHGIGSARSGIHEERVLSAKIGSSGTSTSAGSACGGSTLGDSINSSSHTDDYESGSGSRGDENCIACGGSVRNWDAALASLGIAALSVRRISGIAGLVAVDTAISA